MDIYQPINLADPVNRHHRLNDGRISWWVTLPGLDGGNKFHDVCGNNHGTLTNMTTSASGWRGRSGGGGLLFDGSNDFVNLGTPNSLLLVCPVTITAWFKLASTSGNKPIYGAYSSTTNHRIWSMIRVDSATLVYYTNKADGSLTFLSVAAALSVNLWYRVVITVAGTLASPMCTIYLNGAVANSSAMAALTATPDATLPRYIGGNYYGDRFNGVIDDVSVSSRAWSSSEVREDYDLSRRGYPGVLNRIGSLAAVNALSGIRYVGMEGGMSAGMEGGF